MIWRRDPPKFPGDPDRRHGPAPLVDGHVAKPVDCCAIYLPEGVPPAAFKTADYSSLRELLDDVYVHYLAEFVPPFSYGKDWILSAAYDIVIASAVWAGHRETPLHELVPGWVEQRSLQDVNMTSSYLSVDLGPFHHPYYFGLTFEDPDVRRYLTEEMKAGLTLLHRIECRLVKPASELGPGELDSCVMHVEAERLQRLSRGDVSAVADGEIYDLRGDVGAELGLSRLLLLESFADDVFFSACQLVRAITNFRESP